MTGVHTAMSAAGREGHIGPLLELVQEINGEASLESVFSLVADALRQVFNIDRFAIVLVQDDGSLRVTGSEGLSEAYLETVRHSIDKGMGARALAQRKPVYLRDAPNSPEYHPLQEAARDEGFHTVLIWPLFSGPDPLGYVIMYHDDIREYTPAEVTLAQAMVQQAALAVQHNRLLVQGEAY
ncbi:MAG TPA: GAF domain-containing protein, partial [Chloroflexota bacterium]